MNCIALDDDSHEITLSEWLVRSLIPKCILRKCQWKLSDDINTTKVFYDGTLESYWENATFRNFVGMKLYCCYSRNLMWLKKIQNNTSKNVFIVAGKNHFPFKGGLLSLLKHQGWTISAINLGSRSH